MLLSGTTKRFLLSSVSAGEVNTFVSLGFSGKHSTPVSTCILAISVHKGTDFPMIALASNFSTVPVMLIKFGILSIFEKWYGITLFFIGKGSYFLVIFPVQNQSIILHQRNYIEAFEHVITLLARILTFVGRFKRLVQCLCC